MQKMLSVEKKMEISSIGRWKTNHYLLQHQHDFVLREIDWCHDRLTMDTILRDDNMNGHGSVKIHHERCSQKYVEQLISSVGMMFFNPVRSSVKVTDNNNVQKEKDVECVLVKKNLNLRSAVLSLMERLFIVRQTIPMPSNSILICVQ